MSIVDSLDVVPGWTRRRFDRCFTRSKAAGAPNSEPLSVFLNQGIVPRSSRADNRNELGADLADYLVVSPDDLVFNRLRTWQGGFGRSAFAGIVSPAYFVCRPSAHVSARFADYLLHSAPYLTELARLSKWQPPSQFDLPWDQLRLLPLLAPSEARQREIVAFVDRESAKVSDVITAINRTQLLLTNQRHEAFDQLNEGARSVPLRYVLESLEQGWSPECEAQPAARGEWGVLKTGSVNYGQFRPDQHKRLPDQRAARPELEVKVGDLLMSRANTRQLVGSVAVVEELRQQRLILSDKIYRLNLRPDFDTGFVAAALASPTARDQIELATAGASSSMQNISQDVVRSLRIPDKDYSDQLKVRREVADRESHFLQAYAALDRLVDRLREYRDALITEAVTGRLDATAVSNAQMDERLHEALEAPAA